MSQSIANDPMKPRKLLIELLIAIPRPRRRRIRAFVDFLAGGAGRLKAGERRKHRCPKR
ncbi:hypothetical protein [Burkholderia territorii]|uniref:hypothetical protein n=1 Tax=Burkholderia territorii TaxID=1503055 RepID=UPI0012D9EA71|nr:hypothetical protein [Burkholderia territorii]